MEREALNGRVRDAAIDLVPLAPSSQTLERDSKFSETFLLYLNFKGILVGRISQSPEIFLKTYLPLEFIPEIDSNEVDFPWQISCCFFGNIHPN